MAQTEKPGVIRDERLLLADVEMSETVRGKWDETCDRSSVSHAASNAISGSHTGLCQQLRSGLKDSPEFVVQCHPTASVSNRTHCYCV